jgi:hypothetical protein
MFTLTLRHLEFYPLHWTLPIIKLTIRGIVGINPEPTDWR